jgi:Lon protease-like protein
MAEECECRLFPLPDLVLFPHAVLPLHIFEPRYRQMTADALGTDRLIAIVQIRSVGQGSSLPEPVPIVDVGCLGEIVRHERLKSGRYNLVVLGLKRVRFIREKPGDKLYRIAEAKILEDEEPDHPLASERSELIKLFRSVIGNDQRMDEKLAALLDSDLPVGVLTDVVAHALPLPSPLKQSLLAETHIGRRVESLHLILRRIAMKERSNGTFPPPFSLN